LQQSGRSIPKRPSFADKQVCVMSFNISNPSSLSKPLRAVQPKAAQRRSLLERFQAWRATRAAEAELWALSDRDLKDVGLTRHDIHAAVRGQAAR
jgi:uncharacterized protein YjiS (DUF1127 family)